jgi:hypothetical protein
LGTAVLTTIALSSGPTGHGVLQMSGFTAAFSVAALVAIGTAVLGLTLVRR